LVESKKKEKVLEYDQKAKEVVVEMEEKKICKCLAVHSLNTYILWLIEV
jgi:hypothetical protein